MAKTATFIRMDDHREADLPEREKTKDELRQEALDGIGQIIQFGCILLGDFKDAGAIGMHFPNITKEIVPIARNNSKLAEKLDQLIEVGPYAGLIAAALPFGIQILVNHGVFKPEQFANSTQIVSPEVLETRMKTILMQQQMEALRQQQEVEQQLAEMQAEMNGHSQDEWEEVQPDAK